MKKFRIFWDFEQEEKWLTEMEAQGHILKRYSMLGFYSFSDGMPQQLNYKIDYKLFLHKADFNSYLALFEDAGWQHVWGTQFSGNQYFVPRTPQAGKEIFSDTESSNKRYKIQFYLCLATVAILILNAVSLFITNDFKYWEAIFMTPGLWEKTGEVFWKAFLFELPLAIVRIAIRIILFVTAISYGYWAIKAKQAYDHHASEKEVEL